MSGESANIVTAGFSRPRLRTNSARVSVAGKLLKPKLKREIVINRLCRIIRSGKPIHQARFRGYQLLDSIILTQLYRKKGSDLQ